MAKSVYRAPPDSPNLGALMIDMINKNIRTMLLTVTGFYHQSVEPLTSLKAALHLIC